MSIFTHGWRSSRTPLPPTVHCKERYAISEYGERYILDAPKPPKPQPKHRPLRRGPTYNERQGKTLERLAALP